MSEHVSGGLTRTLHLYIHMTASIYQLILCQPLSAVSVTAADSSLSPPFIVSSFIADINVPQSWCDSCLHCWISHIELTSKATLSFKRHLNSQINHTCWLTTFHTSPHWQPAGPAVYHKRSLLPLLPLLLTVRLARFLLQTRHDVRLQFTQRRRLQRLKVNLNLVRIGVLQRWLTSLYDQHDTTQLITYRYTTNN